MIVGKKVSTRSSVSIVPFVLNVMSPFKIYISIELLIHCVWAVYVSYSSYLTKQIIDKVNNATLEAVSNAVKPYALGYFLLLAFMIILNRVYNWITLTTSPLIEQNTLELLSAHLIRQSYSFYQEQFAGGLANNIRLVASSVTRIIDTVLDRMFRPLITLVVALWTVAQVSSLFTLLLIVWFIFFIAGSLYAAPLLQELATAAAASSSRMVGQLVDMISNIVTIRLFSAKNKELKRVHQFSSELMEAEQKRMAFFLKLQIFQGFLFVAFIGGSLWLLLYGYKQGWVTSGDFALILILNESINHTVWRMAQDLASLYEQAGVIAQGLSIIMPNTLEKQEPPLHPLKVTKGEIIFDNVSFTYNEKAFFKNLSLIIPGGQRVGLVGYSGSGKSTFVNLILRLFELQQGAIFIDKQNIAQVTQTSLRDAISFIPQTPTLFHRTVYENIAYAKTSSTPKEIYEASKHAHAHEFIRELPQGYDTEVGEGGSKLSGGQRQRIGIARAFLKNAPLLLLDEATSQLDAITEKKIQQSVHELMEDKQYHLKKTTLIIAHRLSTLLEMERILVFDKGTIVQDGTHKELLQTPGLYATLWSHQNGGFLGDVVE